MFASVRLTFSPSAGRTSRIFARRSKAALDRSQRTSSPCTALVPGQRAEDPRPDRGHLRPVVRAEDGRHDVAAKGRPGLVEIAGGRVGGEAGAVGGQPGAEPGRHPGRQRPADGRGAQQDDVRAFGPGQLRQDLGIRSLGEVAQRLMLGQVDPVGAMGEELAGEGSPGRRGGPRRAVAVRVGQGRPSPRSSKATPAKRPWRCSAKIQTPE